MNIEGEVRGAQLSNERKAGAASVRMVPTKLGQPPNGNAVVNFQQSVKDPLEPQCCTPSERTNLDTTVNPQGTTITTTGTVSGSPSFELNVGTAGGSITNIPLQTEPSGAAFDLGLFSDNPILNVTHLPLQSDIGDDDTN